MFKFMQYDCFLQVRVKHFDFRDFSRSFAWTEKNAHSDDWKTKTPMQGGIKYKVPYSFTHLGRKLKNNNRDGEENKTS